MAEKKKRKVKTGKISFRYEVLEGHIEILIKTSRQKVFRPLEYPWRLYEAAEKNREYLENKSFLFVKGDKIYPKDKAMLKWFSENKYFEKVKSISNNQYYLKVIDFFEYLSKESKNINEDGNSKLMKQKIDEITQKMEEIDKILNSKELREKYRISDEEAYSEQLNFFLAGGILKAVAGDTEGMVNDFINKIANKQISKEVAEYNQNKEIIIDLLIKVVLAFKEFSGEVPKEGKNFEKLMKRLQETEMYKRIMENSENDEGNANFESTEDKESNIYHEEKKKYDK